LKKSERKREDYDEKKIEDKKEKTIF
jgi:hypothetical protein